MRDDRRHDPFGEEDPPERDWDERGKSDQHDELVFKDEPARSKSGRGWKIALVAVAVGLVLMLLCCGGIGWFGFARFQEWAQKQIQNTNNPEEIREWTDEIISIEIPDDYIPMSGDKVGMANFMGFTIISYDGPEDTALYFVEISGQVASDPQSHAQLEQSLRDMVAQQAKAIQEKSSKIHEIEINGKTVDFKLITGSEAVSGDEWKELRGVVPTNRGLVLVLIQGPSETFDEDAALSMVKTIKNP